MSIKIKRLALGTVQFGLPYGIANKDGQVNESKASGMLNYAADAGIDTLDTAVAYGNSEATLGRIGVDEFKIVTKLPSLGRNEILGKDWIRDHLKESMERLKVDQLYGFLFHRPALLLGPEGKQLYKTLRELKDEGVIKKIGISAYSPIEVFKITEKYQIDLVQLPFNLLDQRLLQSEYLARLKVEGIEVHVRSIFLQGLLLMQKQDIPIKFKKWSSIWEQWEEWLDFNKISALEACLIHSLAIPEIDRIVIGADNLQQLQEIIGVVENPSSLTTFPDLVCNDEALINPANWTHL